MIMKMMMSFWSAVFPENRWVRLKWPPKVPREAQPQLQKFVFIFKMIIMKISSEERAWNQLLAPLLARLPVNYRQLSRTSLAV